MTSYHNEYLLIKNTHNMIIFPPDLKEIEDWSNGGLKMSQIYLYVNRSIY